MVLLNLIPFTLSTWLGLFLLGRGAHPRLRLTGLGLLFYAAALAIDIPNLALALRSLPPVLWVGAILYLDQRIIDGHPVLFASWKWFLLPVTVLLGGFFLLEPATSSTFPFLWLTFLLGLTPLFWTLVLVRDYRALLRPRQVTGILFAATLFFALGEAVLLFPTKWFPQQYALPGIGIDLLLLGFCIAWFDAFDEGETFLPGMIRSLALTLLLVLIFAGQVGFVIAIQTGLTEGMQILLTTTILASILIAVFGNTLEARLDRLAFSRIQPVREARPPPHNGISHLVPKRPADRSGCTERRGTCASHAAGVKSLRESYPPGIQPADAASRHRPEIESTPGARHHAGTRRGTQVAVDRIDPEAQAAERKGIRHHRRVAFLQCPVFSIREGTCVPTAAARKKVGQTFEKEAVDWFQAFVPERTLHNWQNAGAKLIANDLWEGNFS